MLIGGVTSLSTKNQIYLHVRRLTYAEHLFRQVTVQSVLFQNILATTA